MRLRVLLFAVPAATLVTSLPGQQLPPVHLLDRPSAESGRDFRSVSGIRHLPDGDLLVNDAGSHRLVLVDRTLKTVRLVADSAEGTATSYGPSAAFLLAYAGDSSVLVLPRIPSMYLIDPAGKIVRVMSVPRPQDAQSLGSVLGGNPGFDAKGGLVYRGRTPPASMPPVAPGGPSMRFVFIDSVPLVRVDPATRKVDTLSIYKIPRLSGMRTPTESGRTFVVLENNPLPLTDDWAITSDGTVAVVRGQDYHVDFIDATGAVTKAPKMLYAWEHLTDDGKVALIDSVRRADSLSNLTPPPVAGSGASTQAFVNSGGAGATSAGVAAGGVSFGAAGPHPDPLYISPQELPDYRPAFTTASVRADADDNLWIRTTHRGPFGAGAAYDVVNRKGVVVDRVQLLPGRTIAGFAPGGIVYLAAKDDAGTVLEQTTWTIPK